MNEYDAPSIVDYGHLVDLTEGNETGDVTDAAFPIATPFTEITFS